MAGLQTGRCGCVGRVDPYAGLRSAGVGLCSDFGGSKVRYFARSAPQTWRSPGLWMTTREIWAFSAYSGQRGAGPGAAQREGSVLVGKPGKWVVAAAVGVLLCLVSGCSGSSEQPGSTATASSTDSPTTSASASATATPSTSATAPPAEIPADARPATIDGAQQFTKFWVQQLNIAFQTANPHMIANLSAPECPVCQTMISEVQKLKNLGQHVDGELWTVQTAATARFDNAMSAMVFTTIRQNPVPSVDESGAVIDRYVARTDDLGFTLSHNGSTWRIDRIQGAQ